MMRSLFSLIVFCLSLTAFAERSYLCFDTIVADGSARFALPAEKLSRITVEVRAGLQGVREHTGESRHRWGMEFDNGLTVTLRSGNTAYGDAADTRYVRVQVHLRDSLLLDRRFVKELTVDPDRTVSLIVNFRGDGTVELLGGERVPAPLCTVNVDTGWPSSVALLADGKLRVDGLVAEYEPDRVAPLLTRWTIDSLAECFATTRDPLEGFWTFLDRENDPLFVRPGGRYTLGCIAEDGGGYTLIYVDGAQVNEPNWHPGMIKGRLTPTPFRDQYDLLWYDSEMLPIKTDIHARIDQNALMTLSFPLLKTTLRFAKQPLGNPNK